MTSYLILVAITALTLTVLIELWTLYFRFVLGKQSTRDTRWMANFTFGLRIHHGYVGAVLVLVSVALGTTLLAFSLLVVGIAMILSDIVHHYLLWVLTGNANMDLVYPSDKKNPSWWTWTSEIYPLGFFWFMIGCSVFNGVLAARRMVEGDVWWYLLPAGTCIFVVSSVFFVLSWEVEQQERDRIIRARWLAFEEARR